MDTSINLKEALVIDLKQSSSPEERELAAKAEELIRGITSKLKPILKYVTTPQLIHVPFTQGNFLYAGEHGDREYRVIYLCHTEKRARFEEKEAFSRMLFLAENGEFFTTNAKRLGGGMVLEKVEYKGSTWQYFPFGDVLCSLQRALKAAEEKREKHLQSIRDAREMLDRAIAAISPTS